MRLLVLVVVALCLCGGQTASLPSASPAVVRIPSPGINLSSAQSLQPGDASSLPAKSAGAPLPAFKSAIASHPAETSEKVPALPSAAVGIPAPAMQFSPTGFAYPSVKSATAHKVAESEKGDMSPAVMKIPTPGINLSPSSAFQSVQTPEIVVKSGELQIQKTSEELDATFDTSVEQEEDIKMVSLKADMEMMDDDEASSVEYEEMKEEVVMKASMDDDMGAPFTPKLIRIEDEDLTPVMKTADLTPATVDSPIMSAPTHAPVVPVPTPVLLKAEPAAPVMAAPTAPMRAAPAALMRAAPAAPMMAAPAAPMRAAPAAPMRAAPAAPMRSAPAAPMMAAPAAPVMAAPAAPMMAAPAAPVMAAPAAPVMAAPAAPMMATPAATKLTAPATPMMAAPAPLLLNAASPALAPASVIAVPAPDPLLAPEPPMPSVSIPHVGGWFYAQDEAGQYNFGHWGGPNTRVENRDFLGRISGSFAYVDPIGDVQIRKYGAAPVSGFRVATSDIPLDSNGFVQDTPEVAMIKSANALLHANIAKILANPTGDLDMAEVLE